MRLLIRLFWSYRLWRARRYLQKRVARTHKSVHLEVIPKELTLHSFDPDRQQTGSVNGTPVTFSFSTWHGEAYFPFWKSKVQISISVGGTRPTRQQCDLAKAIFLFNRCIRDEVEAAIYDYYQSRVYGSFSAYDGAKDVTEKYAPRILQQSEISKLLFGPCIHIDDAEDATTRFTLHFGCTWDEEHGVGVVIENWEIKRIGI